MNQSPARFPFAFLSMLAGSLLIAGCGGDMDEITHEEDRVGESPDELVGGMAAPDGAFPWMVAVLDPATFCGGSIIGRRTVVTSARCVNNLDPDQIQVQVGSHHLESGGQQIAVTTIRPHPSFDLKSLDNDIALLKLERAVPSSRVIPIASSLPGAGSQVTVLGFGATSTDLAFAPSLQQAKLWLVDRQACQDQHPDRITSSMFCAAAPHKSFCAGDTGGPLVYNGYLVGIASWGACTNPREAGVYTNVSAFKRWIIQNTFG